MRNKYTFTKDDHCITLYRVNTIKDQSSKNYGQEVEQLIGHYSDVSSLVKKLVHLELIDSGSVSDLLIDLRLVKTDVEKFVKECLV